MWYQDFIKQVTAELIITTTIKYKFYEIKMLKLIKIMLNLILTEIKQFISSVSDTLKVGTTWVKGKCVENKLIHTVKPLRWN